VKDEDLEKNSLKKKRLSESERWEILPEVGSNYENLTSTEN
jgi:hypothetical protein